MKLVHGGDVEGFRRTHPGREPLDFSANINPLGMPSSVRRALEGAADACLHYPDPLCRALREALAEFEGVDRDHILCGNGAADLIYRAVQARKPRRALLLAPTFAEYALALERSGCRVERHFLGEETDFTLDRGILPRLKGVDMAFLCNPNNPTGSAVDPALLEGIRDRCRREGILLAVDECFLDFVEGGEVLSLKDRLGEGGLLILKAFTKSFAMPGLRLGYALSADRTLLEEMAEGGPPWNVSVPAQLCGIAAAGERAFLERSRGIIREQRELLRRGLEKLELRVVPSAANYLLFRADREDLCARLREHGILLRDCRNYPGLGPGWYRTAVRTGEENRILLEALEGILRGES